MTKYRQIIASGCSFVEGCNILDSNKEWIGNQYRMSKILADRFDAEEINVAAAGAGNQYIIDAVVNKLESLADKQKTLVVVGLSGISRISVYSNNLEDRRDLHLFDILSNKERLPRRAELMTGRKDMDERFYDYVDFHARYFFNVKNEERKLRNSVKMLAGYLDNLNIDYVVFNSIEDHLGKMKRRVNFLSFDSTLQEDTWAEYLRNLHRLNFGKKHDPELRSNTPPYGEYFCGSHPSPEANIVLADKISYFLKTKKIL